MSKRTEIAKKMADNEKAFEGLTSAWLNIIYAFERQGYQVVPTSETAEAQAGLRVAGDD